MLPEQFREIIVLRYDHNRAVGTPGSREDYWIAGAQQTQFLDVYRVNAVFRPKPSCQSCRQLSINPDLSWRCDGVTFAHFAAIFG